MPIYGDDECEECGGIRVAKSTLCAGCLVKRLDAERAENLIKRTVIEGLEGKVETYHGQLENALAYGFKQNQENVKLKVRCERMGNIALRRGKYEKDG